MVGNKWMFNFIIHISIKNATPRAGPMGTQILPFFLSGPAIAMNKTDARNRYSVIYSIPIQAPTIAAKATSPLAYASISLIFEMNQKTIENKSQPDAAP